VRVVSGIRKADFLVCFDLGRKYGLRFGGEAAIP
jgi:hypothetical protein